MNEYRPNGESITTFGYQTVASSSILWNPMPPGAEVVVVEETTDVGHPAIEDTTTSPAITTTTNESPPQNHDGTIISLSTSCQSASSSSSESFGNDTLLHHNFLPPIKTATSMAVISSLSSKSMDGTPTATITTAKTPTMTTKASTSGSSTCSGSSSSIIYQQLIKHQQNQIIHYPAEFMQLGKRKHIDDSCSDVVVESAAAPPAAAVQQQQEQQCEKKHFKTLSSSSSLSIEAKALQPPDLPFPHHVENNNNNISDNEAGLSLLFAASLLQQHHHDNHQQQYETITALQQQQPTINDVAYGGWVPQQGHDDIDNEYQNTTIMQGMPYPTTPYEIGVVNGILLEAMEEYNWIEPRDNDVLCGRGGGINKHYGNIMYRRVVEYNKGVYKQVPKRHRMLVSRSIVQTIINSGGRFLQQQQQVKMADVHNTDVGGGGYTTSKSCWTSIPIRRAVQKTSQALRERSCIGNHDDEEEEDEAEEEENNHDDSAVEKESLNV